MYIFLSSWGFTLDQFLFLIMNNFIRLTDCRRHVATHCAVKNTRSKLVNGRTANIIRHLRTVRITLHALLTPKPKYGSARSFRIWRIFVVLWTELSWIGVLQQKESLILYLHKSHNTPLLPPKNLHRHCFRLLLGNVHVPGEIEKQWVCKRFGGLKRCIMVFCK